MSCSAAFHALVKSTPRAWRVLTLVGVQHIPADETGPAESLELRNCSCGSTLAISIETPLVGAEAF